MFLDCKGFLGMVGLPWAVLYADDLMVLADGKEEVIIKL